MCGLLNVLIAGAFGIKGARETLKPSIVVTWGSKHRFQTFVVTDAPGTDINNPTFDSHFRVPIATTDTMTDKLRIACMDDKTEVGAVEVSLEELQKAAAMTMQESFDLGNGLKVRASVSLRGLKAASMQKVTLTQNLK
jgi:hypothetical protein